MIAVFIREAADGITAKVALEKFALDCRETAEKVLALAPEYERRARAAEKVAAAIADGFEAAGYGRPGA